MAATNTDTNTQYLILLRANCGTPRFLADLANQFHGGGKISFLELVSGVQSVEDATQLPVNILILES